MSWKSDGKWYGPHVEQYQSDDGIRMRVTRHWSNPIEFEMATIPYNTRADKFARDRKVLIMKVLDTQAKLKEASENQSRLLAQLDHLGSRAPSPTTGNEVLQRPVGIPDPAVAEQGG